MPCYFAYLIWDNSYGRNFIQWAYLPPQVYSTAVNGGNLEPKKSLWSKKLVEISMA